jgi:GT2 family glycosyltransferase
MGRRSSSPITFKLGKWYGFEMRASLIIASHNEGEALAKTIESCIETCANLDYEILVADDASTDGSVEDASRRFSQIRLYRHEQRQGASPTKALGGRHAQGEVLVFLDAHTKAEHGAIIRLVEDVEETAGHAIITPAVATLDVQRWQNNFAQVGNGYTLNLQTFECGWKSLDEMQGAQERRRFYESPALIGCALAVSRNLYETLCGFDSHMRSWGVEDLDFGLKCWLMGYRILHDPDAVIGHRFRASFDNFSVPIEHVLINQLRMARKNFTDSVWAEWLQGWGQRHSGRLGGHPEGLWAHAWLLFNADRPSVEQERSYLHARRSHDEFWYAERFGLSWPCVQPAPGTVPLLTFAGAAQSRVAGITPAAPTILLGQPQTFTAERNNLSEVLWSAPSATPAYGSGPTFTTRWTASGAFTVTASCGSTNISTIVVVVAVTGVLTPDDNFSGRSTINFGVGEIIHLSFVSTPPRTAAQLGGLRWYIASGRGRLTGTSANNGRGDYTAPAGFGPVQLQLKVVSGPNAGLVVARSDVTIVEPNDAMMAQEPGTSIRHVTGSWGIGFYGVPFLRPIDVSFARMMFGEGAATSMASGFLAPLDSLGHQASPLFTVGRGDSVRGCQVNVFDLVSMGNLPGPFSTGDFEWTIPWEFSAGGSRRVAFTTAELHATADAAGTAVISKKGAGPFTRLVDDPTAPALTAIEPSSGPSSGGTKVTITGRGLSDASAVMFGTTPAASLAVVNDTLISAVSSVGSGVVEVVVWFPHFAPTPVVRAGRFTFIPPPVITNASP